MRESGILMHITSLPSAYGVGTMGKEAYRFVDFLEKAGQAYWQILPVTPTGFGDSPYQSCSAYAGNPYLIDLDMLVEEGLLKKSEITKIKWFETPDRVDFGRLYHHRQAVLRLAFGRFQNREALAKFCREKEARMNTPGVLSSANWTWRAQKGYLSAPLRKRIYRLTELYGRLGINN